MGQRCHLSSCFQMEFSFGARRWIQIDSLTDDQDQIQRGHALGLHAPGFFDKVLHIEKCLLQSEAANKVTLLSDYSSFMITLVGTKRMRSKTTLPQRLK